MCVVWVLNCFLQSYLKNLCLFLFMVKVKLIDLFNVKFENMESKINEELEKLELGGFTIKKIKTIGDSLKNTSVFVIYE